MSDVSRVPFGTWTYSLVGQDLEAELELEHSHSHVLAIPLDMQTRAPMVEQYGEVLLCGNQIMDKRIINAPPNGADPGSKDCTAMLVAVTHDGHYHYLDYVNDVPVFADMSMN